MEDRVMFRFEASSSPQVLSVFKHRGRVAIIGDILKTVNESKNGRKKTQIMQSANLSYNTMKKYLNYLMNCGFLVVTKKQTYVITSKGSRFLQFAEIQEIHNLR